MSVRRNVIQIPSTSESQPGGPSRRLTRSPFQRRHLQARADAPIATHIDANARGVKYIKLVTNSGTIQPLQIGRWPKPIDCQISSDNGNSSAAGTGGRRIAE